MFKVILKEGLREYLKVGLKRRLKRGFKGGLNPPSLWLKSERFQIWFKEVFKPLAEI